VKILLLQDHLSNYVSAATRLPHHSREHEIVMGDIDAIRRRIDEFENTLLFCVAYSVLLLPAFAILFVHVLPSPPSRLSLIEHDTVEKEYFFFIMCI